ncbi:MAG: DUF5020 family protein [Bacteroidales bacterium]|jgi:hypothetical protein|nr:DUF5020 family protein [Bacteroidales bacterium]
MKKLFLALFFVSLFGALSAQNVQLHYDMGKDRGHLTSTVEYFGVDKYGSTFFFTDMDYDGENGGVNLAYWEIARTLKFWKAPIEAHVEYNGGTKVGVGSLKNAYLTGVSYPLPIKGGSYTIKALYKYTEKVTNSADMQITGVWFTPLFKGKLTFNGFFDIWSEGLGNDDSKWVFIAEPQLWFNISKHFAVGGELEISNNFIPNTSGMQFMPTLGVKYTL